MKIRGRKSSDFLFMTLLIKIQFNGKQYENML